MLFSLTRAFSNLLTTNLDIKLILILKDSNIPVLDLPNTFNPNNNLYECGIEPNGKGSKLIAEGIAHIVQNHDFNDQSVLYAKNDQNYSAAQNTPYWSVAYPQK